MSEDRSEGTYILEEIDLSMTLEDTDLSMTLDDTDLRKYVFERT